MKALRLVTILAIWVTSCDQKPATPSDADPNYVSLVSARKKPCPSNAAFHCSNEAVWRSAEVPFFGTDASPIDADGCMRVACTTDDQCAGNEFCFRPSADGGCYSSSADCNEETSDQHQVCVCSRNPDCGGGYCKSK
jgi:hypothetical protein